MQMTNIWRRATGVAIAAAAVLFAVYGIWLLFIGPGLVTVTPEGGIAASSNIPSPLGVVPILAAALLSIGLARDDERLNWAGAGTAAIFAAAFLFSIGGILSPIAALLLVMLASRQLIQPRDIHRR
jgi:hypothetical protein